jgi:CRP-like cAMP-binding protein
MSEHHFLTNIFPQANFSAEDYELILSQYQYCEFNKGDYLIKEGSTAAYYYFLESGFARSYVIDLEGNDISTKFYGSKDLVIDWHSYFLKTQCRETTQAISNCKAWKITFEKFMKLFHIEAFREIGRTRLISNYFDLKNHSISMIADPAKDRYLHLLETQPDIVQNVPLKQIATYLGVTDTSLSRIRKEIAEHK